MIWGPWILMAFVGLALVWETRRGERAIERLVQQAEEQGMSLEWSQLNATALPPEKNVTLLPMLTNQWDADRYRATPDLVRLGRQPAGITNEREDVRAPVEEPLLTAQQDLRLWLEESSRPGDLMEAVRELDRIRDDRRQGLDELAGALQTKEFQIDYDPSVLLDLNKASLSYLDMLHLAGACEEDVIFAVHLQDDERALSRLRIFAKMLGSQEQPVLLSALVKAAVTSLMLDSVEEILRGLALSDDQLQEVETLLRASPYDGLPRVVQGELAFGLVALEEALAEMNFFEDRDLFALIPKGTYKASWANEARAVLEALQGLDLSKEPDRLSFEKRLAAEAEARLPLHDYLGGTARIISSHLAKVRRIEAQRLLVLTAIALERYRLSHGVYPEKLSELPVTLPNDPFSQAPFRYLRKPDGTPHLWSVGPDKVDDKGLPGRGNRGDLVWMTTPIPGLTPEEWRKATRLSRSGE
ncbi:MAG: hypothetical protein Q7Q71_04625 [Verrucomicrobiota bacterium JB023]|nr:hypothetical protein [Verrucomicrobiota bacterium JB023]